jgi:hypothetical protein
MKNPDQSIIPFEFPKGDLLVICGRPSCGKTMPQPSSGPADFEMSDEMVQQRTERWLKAIGGYEPAIRAMAMQAKGGSK